MTPTRPSSAGGSPGNSVRQAIATRSRRATTAFMAFLMVAASSVTVVAPAPRPAATR